MIKTCLFDLGNVLLSFSHDKMAQQIAALFSVTPQEIRKTIFESPLLAQTETGEVTEAQLQKILEEKYETRVSNADLKIASADIFQPIEPMVEAVHELNRQGIRLVLMSNTCSTHMEFAIERFDFLKLFDHYVLSYEAGCMKPEQPIYDDAKKWIDCEPSECFYTDDIEKNIVAGREFGFDAEVFVGPDAFKEQMKSRGIDL